MPNNTRAISMRRLPARLVAFAAVLTALGGCAAGTAEISSPAFAPASAARSLAERDRLLTSLQTPAIMEYSGPSGHIKVREQFSVRRPASLRVDAMSPLGVALIVAADNARIAVFNPSDNTLIRGPANSATLERFTRIPMTPVQAVQLLLGLAPDNAVLATSPSRSSTEGEMTVLSYAGATINYELGFKGNQLELVRGRDVAGQVTYEVHYSDYRDIGAMKFPFELEARFFASAATIKLRYLNPSIDRQIAESTFVLSPAPDTRLIELGFAAPASAQASAG
jgi:outer membrane lipoprotein-sorting protein